MCDHRRQLVALVDQARDELQRIGGVLVEEESGKVSNLIGEIHEIRNNPLVSEIGKPYLGFCSQAGRLAGVILVIGEIGAAIYYATENRRSASARNLALELQGYAGEFGRISSRLQKLSGTDAAFIVCDARVLHDHPDLVHADEVKCRLSAATDLLEEMSEVWWMMADKAKKMAATYEAALAAYSSPHKLS
jgi:predicted ABC-type transport system involved in lysophospholipase L1 biosynthesis ATPase subunit